MTIDRTSSLPRRPFPLPQVTARLTIRPFTLDDAEAIFSVHGDPECSRYMGGTLTREQSRENLQALVARVQETAYGPFALERLDTGNVIGWAGIQQLPGEPHLEVLYALQRAQWVCGYATEAAERLLEIAFKELSLEIVVATVEPRNDASIRVLSRLGFRVVGPYRHKLHPAEGVLYRLDRAAFLRALACDRSE